MYLIKVSDWTKTEDGCGAYRCILGKDGAHDPAYRVAFIEKTPRVRVRRHSEHFSFNDCFNWAERPFKGDGPDDAESREWCDAMLRLLGYAA